MRVTPTHVLSLATVGLLAFAAYYVARRGVGGAAAAATEALVDAGTGAVIGIGKSIGIPETNRDACAQAIYEGRTWDASFACPAGTFIKSLFTGAPPVDQTILDPRDAMAKRGLGVYR